MQQKTDVALFPARSDTAPNRNGGETAGYFVSTGAARPADRHPPHAPEVTRPLFARRTSTQTSYSPWAVDENVPAPKAAAEMAIAEFAAQAVSEAAAVLSN